MIDLAYSPILTSNCLVYQSVDGVRSIKAAQDGDFNTFWRDLLLSVTARQTPPSIQILLPSLVGRLRLESRDNSRYWYLCSRNRKVYLRPEMHFMLIKPADLFSQLAQLHPSTNRGCKIHKSLLLPLENPQ